LEVQLGRVLMRSIVQNQGKFVPQHFQQAYIDFMTTPGSHNDTYASTCHRMFFYNWYHRKLPPSQCPDNDSHNVDTIDGLVLPTIVSLVYAAKQMIQPTRDGGVQDENIDVAKVAASCAAVTRRSSALQQASEAWSEFIVTALKLGVQLNANSVTDSASTDNAHPVTTSTINSVLISTASRAGITKYSPNPNRNSMTACYLSSAMPALLDNIAMYDQLTYSQSSSSTTTTSTLEKVLLLNANTGGENVHRGSCLGAALGAMTGCNSLPMHLVTGLYHHDEIEKEINAFVDVLVPV
jgi:ADP-ribosyl-[dinitrogen reductase] hydrolase